MVKRAGLALGLAAAATAAAAAAALTVAALHSAPGAQSDVYAAKASSTASAAADVSSNWAGYVSYGIGSTATTASSAMAFTDVTGQWTQPAATCTPGSASSAAVWVGIGGYSQSSQKLEQTGTSADCDANGKATYYAWYELVPADSVNIKLKIVPGDVIASTVLISGNDVLVQVKNRTRKTAFTKHLTMTSPDLTSAEWIAEAPSLCGPGGCRDLKLTNFGSVTFTRTFATGNGTGGTITSPNWVATPIQLVPQARRFFGDNAPQGATGAGAAPSALAADGSGFTINWQANPATATT